MKLNNLNGQQRFDKMHQFFTDQSLELHQKVTLSSAQQFQIFKVLKLKSTEVVRIVNHEGVGFEAEVTMDQQFILTKPIDFISNQRRVVLGLSLIRSEKLELALQKATEVGVDEIVLIDAQRSVVKFKPDVFPKKLKRYQTILMEAAEQAQRQFIPKISTLVKSTNIHSLPYAEVYYGDLSEKTFSLKSLSPQQMVMVLIGPEGGWSPQELIYFESANFKPIRFSKQTLRAETAAIIASHLLVNHES